MADVGALDGVYRRSSLSNDGDRPSLLAHPDALVFDDTAVREQRTRVAVGVEVIVGFATLRTIGSAAELDDLFVDPPWMRRGIARLLIDDAVSLAADHRLARIDVTANVHALAFYQAVGFVHDGVTSTQFGSGFRMHLDVPNAPTPPRTD